MDKFIFSIVNTILSHFVDPDDTTQNHSLRNGSRDVMIVIIGNELGDPCLSPWQGYLHVT